MRNSPPLPVDQRDLTVLHEWAGSGGVAARRARIVLLSADGLGPTAVAAEVGCSKQTVITWRDRYRSDGVAGLRDAPRSGRPVSVNPGAVISRTMVPPPARLRARRWSSRLLASELGISNVAVANVWRSWGVVPLPGGRVRLAVAPVLDGPLAGVVGLHRDPTVGVLALVTANAAEPAGEVPVAERPRLGARLADLDPAPAPPSPVPLTDFLAGLRGIGGGRLRLLVDSPVPQLASWAAARAVTMHVVPDGLDWPRLVRVACLLAGATVEGAAAVADLRRVVLDHRMDRPLSWLAPTIIASSSH